MTNIIFLRRKDSRLLPICFQLSNFVKSAFDKYESVSLSKKTLENHRRIRWTERHSKIYIILVAFYNKFATFTDLEIFFSKKTKISNFAQIWQIFSF